MSINNPPPTEYFNGIIYNPVFFATSSFMTFLYGTQNFLSRVGVATSTALSTTFSGLVTVNGGVAVTNGIGTDNLTFSGTINTITASTFNFISDLTGLAQAQFNAITQRITGITYSSPLTTIANNVSITGNTTLTGTTLATGSLTLGSAGASSIILTSPSATITQTLLSYLTGVTSNIQTQLTTLFTRTTDLSYASLISTFANGLTVTGATVLTGTTLQSGSLTLGSAGASSIILTSPSATITQTLLSYLTGVTSNLQTQLTTLFTRTTDLSYASLISTFANGLTVTGNTILTGTTLQTGSLTLGSAGASSIILTSPSATITQTLLSYLTGVTSNIQTQLTTLFTRTTDLSYASLISTFANGLTVTGNTVHTGTTLATGSLTLGSAGASSIILTSPVATITQTLLSYLTGVTSNIQTQLTTLFTRTTDLSYASLISTIANGLTVTGNTVHTGTTTCNSLLTANAGIYITGHNSLSLYDGTNWTGLSQNGTQFGIINGGTALFGITGLSTFQSDLLTQGILSSSAVVDTPQIATYNDDMTYTTIRAVGATGVSILAGTFTVNPHYGQEINFITPVAIRLGASPSIPTTYPFSLSAITMIIYKDGVSWATSPVLLLGINGGLTISKSILANGTFTAEQYYTCVTTRFVPDDDVAQHIYTVKYTATFSGGGNFIVNSNANTTLSTGIVSFLSASGLYYTPATVTIMTNYVNTTLVGSLQCKHLNVDNITTNTLDGSVIMNDVYYNGRVACYFFNSGTSIVGAVWLPMFRSSTCINCYGYCQSTTNNVTVAVGSVYTTAQNIQSTDDYYMLMPNFGIKVLSTGLATELFVACNTSTSPLLLEPITHNVCGSIELYWNGDTLNPI